MQKCNFNNFPNVNQIKKLSNLVIKEFFILKDIILIFLSDVDQLKNLRSLVIKLINLSYLKIDHRCKKI